MPETPYIERDLTRHIDVPTPSTAGSDSAASLIVISGWEIGREIELGPLPNETVLGRSPDAHIVIPDSSVSRQHARLSRGKDGQTDYMAVVDLGSSNGTFVNGASVRSEQRLRSGDKISLGVVVFKYVVQDAYDQQFHQRVHRLIHYDQLTGLMTRESFMQYLQGLMSSGDHQNLTLAMTDLDGLKQVNDTHGHLAGQHAVRTMGSLIRGVLRSQDRAGLYGGDETMIVFPDTKLEGATGVAEQIRDSVENHVFTLDEITFHVTISQGLAEWPVGGGSATALIASADKALYAAKAAGRNCVRTFED
jgi:diguanylate cyclase (GGDEF)-like protein